MSFVAATDSSLYDDSLDDAIQAGIVGALGALPGELVKPRWQPEPPNAQQQATNWASVGVVSSEMSVNSYEEALLDDNTLQIRYLERLYVLVSFYGTNAALYDARLRAGLMVTHNTAAFRAAGLAVVEHGTPTRVPSLLKARWQPRVDSTLILSRFSAHKFGVGRIKFAALTIDSETQQRGFSSIPLPP